MLPTYQDYLRENGLVELPKYLCPQPGCKVKGPAFTIVNIAPEGEPYNFICSICHDYAQNQIELRNRLRKEQEDELRDPWSTGHGAEIRAIRNRLLEQSNWAIQADSPLTPICRLLFIEYRKLLNSLTVDYAAPYLAVMPEAPALEFVTP